MRARLLSLVALLCLAVLAVPAVAPAALPANVKRVRDDFRNDGKISPCRHSAKDLRDTLEVIQPNTRQYSEDFPASIRAALEVRASGDCVKQKEATPTPTPSAPAAPAPAAPGAPAPAPSTPLPESPAAPAAPADPLPKVEPAPPAAPPQEVVPPPPAPDGAGIAPGTPAVPAADPDLVLKRAAARGSDVGPAPWIILGGLLGASLLAAALLGFMRRFGWGEERLAPVLHAVGEAGYRTGGTWQAFTDWVRRGR